MSAGVTAFLGAIVGAVVTLFATFGVLFVQNRQRRRERREKVVAQLKKERQIEYVNLLTSAREVRYAALRIFEDRAIRPVGEVDSLLTQMSRAYYIIALITPEDTRRLAWELREAVFNLWQRALDYPEPRDYRDEFGKVRALVEEFRNYVKNELAESADEARPAWRGVTGLSLGRVLRQRRRLPFP